MHHIKQLEHQVIGKLLDDALAAGLDVDVNDGAETTLRHSKDKAAILLAMFTTDEDWLTFWDGPNPRGWVRLIYGNDGWDVINDYVTSLAGLMEGTNALVERLADENC